MTDPVCEGPAGSPVLNLVKDTFSSLTLSKLMLVVTDVEICNLLHAHQHVILLRWRFHLAFVYTGCFRHSQELQQ